MGATCGKTGLNKIRNRRKTKRREGPESDLRKREKKREKMVCTKRP